MPTRVKNLYYQLKPLIPRSIQLKIRRKIISIQREKYKDIWPIDESSAIPPKGWQGWPDGKKFALVLTHDVETEKGLNNCSKLIELEKSLGFRSSFNFVAEDYNVPSELRQHLTNEGFEVGIHGLSHDGKLYSSRETFKEQAKLINQYLMEWKSVGFRSPSMHHNLKWLHDLNIEYDASTFDTDPFEPLPCGMKTIFPFWVSEGSTKKGYIELPYTLPQDFTLFILMNEKNINVWKQKLEWIVEKGGMVLLITHPDYMNFNNKKMEEEEYPVGLYVEFLTHIKKCYEMQYWNSLPREMARYCMMVPNNNDNIAIKKCINYRTLMLVENGYPNDIRVRKEAATLTQAGYSVTVIALRTNKEKSFEEIDGVKVYRIPQITLFDKTNNNEANIIYKAYTVFKSITGYIFEYLYFTTVSFCLSLYILMKHGFDAIHAHNPPDTLSIMGIFYRIIGKKYVFDHHDLAPELYLTRVSGKKDLIYKILIIFEKLSCKYADTVISTNESYKEMVVKRHAVNSNKVYIVRNNPIINDCLLYKNGSDILKRERDKKVLVFIGNINPQDGVGILLQVLHYLVYKENRTDFICNIIGAGDSLDSVMQKARELGLMDYIDFKGYIFERDKIKEYLCSADIGVEPAPYNEVNQYSTFIKVMEYMAAGIPLVAFDLKETRYSVDGTGLLVPPGDIEGFAKAIHKLLAQTSLREELGKAGLARIKQELSWGNASLNLVEAYKGLS